MGGMIMASRKTDRPPVNFIGDSRQVGMGCSHVAAHSVQAENIRVSGVFVERFQIFVAFIALVASTKNLVQFPLCRPVVINRFQF
jgi:hypothetical protein